MRINARYRSAGLPDIYRGNALIESLPPLRSAEEVQGLLLGRPKLDCGAIRRRPHELRIHYLPELERLFVPRPELLEIESEISTMIRNGYRGRDPLLPSSTRAIYTVKERLRTEAEAQGAGRSPLPACLNVTALSGSGKSRGIREVLARIPQVIDHTTYRQTPLRTTQITWLSLDAPVSGSPNGLLLRAFGAVDRALGISRSDHSYVNQHGKRRISVDQKIELLGQIAATYNLGLLHVDDLQRLTDRDATEGKQVLTMLIQLANVVKVPLVLSGTYQMARLFSGSLEAGRRLSTGTTIDLPLPASADDEHFAILVQALQRFQLTDRPVDFDEAWRRELFELSRGLPAVLMTVYIGAQKLALRQRADSLTLDHLRRSFKANCSLLEPALKALSGADPASYRLYEDLLPTRAQLESHNQKAQRAPRK